MKTVVVVLAALGVSGCNRGVPSYIDRDTQYQRQLDQAEEQLVRTRKQMDDYDRQSKIADEHQDRQRKLLEKQEEQSRRMDAILDAMEKRYGIKR